MPRTFIESHTSSEIAEIMAYYIVRKEMQDEDDARRHAEAEMEKLKPAWARKKR
jgi:hypothetical protein